MTLQTSLVISGDASGATTVIDLTTGEMTKLYDATGKAADSADRLTAAVKTQADATRDAGAAAADLATSQGEVGRSAEAAAGAHADGAEAAGRSGEAYRALGESLGETIKKLGEGKQAGEALRGVAQDAGAAIRQFASESGDAGGAIAGIAAQAGGAAGQIKGMAGVAVEGAEGAALMSGSLELLAGVAGGVLGVAIAAGVELLGDFIAKQFEADHGAEELAHTLRDAATAADSFGDAQAAIGRVIDLTTGKLKTQNTVLIETIRLQAEAKLLTGETRERTARQDLQGVGERSFAQRTADGLRGYFASEDGGGVRGANQASTDAHVGGDGLRRLRDRVLSGELRDPTAIRRAVDGADLGLTPEETIRIKQRLYELPAARNDQQAAREMLDALDGRGLAPDLQQQGHDPTLRLREPRTRTGSGGRGGGASTGDGTTLAAFGRDAAAQIARIREQFDGTPPAVRAVNDQVGRLNELIGKLNDKKPPGFEHLIDQAHQAQTAVQDGLVRPLRDYVEEQNRAFTVGQALLDGDIARAEAMKAVTGLERQMGPLSAQQKDAVLATVQALDAQARALDVIHEKEQLRLQALGGIKDVFREATQEFERGQIGQLLRNPGKLLDIFTSLKGEVLFDKLFGSLFRDLQDQVTGTHIVEDASARMASAVDVVARQADRTADALGRVATAAEGRADGVPTIGSQPGGQALGETIAASVVAGFASIGRAGGAAPGTDGGLDHDIEVRADTRLRDPLQLFTRAIGGVGERVAGLFTNPENARAIGTTIGKFAGKGLEGAATGTFVAGVGNSLGIGLSSSGSQLGGALGGILGGIKGVTSALGPFGAALTPVLSVVGGLVGKLFAPKAKPGGATVSAVDGAAAVSGTVGSNKSGIATGTGLGGQVSSTLNQVAQQLGATIGSFNVAIGTYKDDLRVNVNGKALGGVKNSGALSFGSDENAAINAAAGLAIGQGAIAGVSAAVGQALRSSPDVSKALTEALKVQDLETSLGGLGSVIGKAFKDFEAQAAERVRIATQYGFDVVAIEKKNADDRLKLSEQLLTQQVGSLQSLVTELTQGSLFEGSALDKVTALDTAITKAKADLDNGVDGAGDTLAGLYQQRLGSLKDAYGTTGGYAGGYQDTLDSARAAIAAANARIVAASGETKSDPALTTTNKTLDEIAEQQAQMLSDSGQANVLLAQIAAAKGAYGVSYDLSNLVGY
ncbi:hypothetical protein [Sphingomonas sp.]|uniref:hypothetical protein n=1 Tax=Sphingomonas sp. TaxID=28214 RepID=UPI003CC62B56